MGIETAIIGAALLGAGASYASGQRQANAMKDANRQAVDTANKQAKVQEQEMNRLNAKQPNTAGMLASNQLAAQGGSGSTMLTSPSGIDPMILALGKNTLLGN